MSAEAESADPDRDDARRSARQLGKAGLAPGESTGDTQGVHYPFGVPRRFDLATLFTITIAYALLFALLRAIRGPEFRTGSPPLVVAILGAFLTCVGAGQALLFKGRRPRAASVVTGIVIVVAVNLIANLASGTLSVTRAMYGLPRTVITGAILGYGAGGAVAGVFLIADAIRKRLPPRQERELTAGEDDEPFR